MTFWRRLFWLSFVATLVTCRDLTGPWTPYGAVEAPPRPQWVAAVQNVVTCVGRPPTVTFERIKFMLIHARSYWTPAGEAIASTSGRTITYSSAYAADETVVEHELAHALYNVVGHTAEFWTRCHWFGPTAVFGIPVYP